SKDIFVHKNNSDGKDALISSLKRRVKSLENEKKRLKDEINTLYNKIYEDI
ncbi:TPA: transposase, partial [Staphylococcus aureus]|nr:transposase [Staphylococcus aureus]